MPGVSSDVKSSALAASSIVRLEQDHERNLEEAISLSKKAVEAGPNFSSALGTHGYNLFLAGRADEGITYLKRAIIANPRITKNYHQLALVYRDKKDFINAINYHKESIVKVGNDNTLLSQSDRTTRKGRYQYELAKTYSISGLEVDTISLLVEAVSLNQTIKGLLKNDFEQNNYFQQLSGSEAFIKLIEP